MADLYYAIYSATAGEGYQAHQILGAEAIPDTDPAPSETNVQITQTDYDNFQLSISNNDGSVWLVDESEIDLQPVTEISAPTLTLTQIKDNAIRELTFFKGDAIEKWMAFTDSTNAGNMFADLAVRNELTRYAVDPGDTPFPLLDAWINGSTRTTTAEVVAMLGPMYSNLDTNIAIIEGEFASTFDAINAAVDGSAVQAIVNSFPTLFTVP